MAAPQGYSSLGVIGFTDQGTYDNSATYYINDLVHYLGYIYRCKVDGTSGIAPGENVNWTVFIGTPTNIVEELIAPVEVNPSENAYTAGRQFIYNDQLYEVVKAIAVGDALVNISDDANGNIKDADRVETQVLQTRKMIAPIEENPSINAYSIGDQLIYNGLLYNVTATIAIGDSLTVGTNISLSDSVVEQLKTINTTLGDTDISGVGNSVTDAISSLNNDFANISNPNLLDNPWFTVNQRGISTLTSAGFPVDRWKMLIDIGTINVLDIGLELDASSNAITFCQYWDYSQQQVIDFFKSSDTYTYSIDFTVETVGSNAIVWYTNGTGIGGLSSVGSISTSSVSAGTSYTMSFQHTEGRSGTATLYAPVWLYVTAGWKLIIHSLKIEKGSISTLKMDTAPNYQQELAKCQRYYQRFYFSAGMPIGSGYCSGSTQGRIVISLLTQMRVTGAITYTINSINNIILFSSGEEHAISSIDARVNECYCYLKLTTTGLTDQMPCVAKQGNDVFLLELSADL